MGITTGSSVGGWRYRETVLVLCTVAFFITMYGRLAMSPLVPAIVDEFGVSNTKIGFALSGMWFAYGVAQYPSGVVSDLYGERPLILAAIAGTAVTSLLIGTSPVFGMLVLFTIMLGGLAGLHYTVATTFLSRLYDNVGFPIGVHNLGGPTAGLVAPAIVAWIAVRYDWRIAVMSTTVVAIPVIFVFAYVIEPTESRNQTKRLGEQLRLSPMLDVLSRPEIAFTVFIAVIMNFVWQGTASFLPTFLVEVYSVSPTVAGIFFSAYFAIQGLVQVGIGGLSDRFDRDRVISYCLATYLVGFTLLVAGSNTVALTIAILLTAIGLGGFTPVIARFMDKLSDENRGAGFGITQSVCIIVGSLGSVTVGLFADLTGWTIAFGVLVVLIGIATIAFLGNAFFQLGY